MRMRSPSIQVLAKARRPGGTLLDDTLSVVHDNVDALVFILHIVVNGIS